MQLINDKLTSVCEEFNFNKIPFDPIEFANKLAQFMLDNDGIGLAANQVGVPFRIFAIRSNPEVLVMFNPKIVDMSSENIVLEEGCLSFKGLYVKVKRPKHVKVRYTLANNVTETKMFTGITARAILHEIDHLNGILFYNKANRFHREQAFRRFKNAK